MNKALLLIASHEDRSYLDTFARLPVLRGWNVKIAYNVQTSADIQLLATRVGAHAILCSNVEALALALDSQFDYIRSRRAVSLDDYQGSLLTIPPIPGVAPERELIVLLPLAQLVTVNYAPFLIERYITKVTKPETWYPQTKFEWEVFDVTNKQRCEELFQLFSEADLISDDIETATGDPDRRITVCGFTAYNRRTHSTTSIVIPFNSIEAWAWTRRFGELPIRKVLQNGMYDNAYKARWNCLGSHWFWDTQHMFHSWYSELPKRLDFITAFSVRKVRYWKDDGKSGDLHDYYRYNALDTWATLNACLSLIHEMPDWARANYIEEFPKVFPCLHCALDGLAVDMPLLEKVRAEKTAMLQKELSSLQYALATPGFNPNSPKQVAALFTVLGIKGLTGTGKIEMQKARATSPFNDLLLGRIVKWKEASKLNSTYLVPEKFWNNRLYYSLNPAGTDTGRLASRESAFWCGLQIQNMPRGDTVKQCIIADPGWFLCEIDKSQAEARCVGYLSGEEKLIDLVEGPHDYHSYNASAFFGVPYEAIYNDEEHKTLDKELRDLSKRTNHGANYNMGEDVMLDTMGPKNVARARKLLKLPIHWKLRKVTAYLLDRYSNTYPKIKGPYYQHIVKRIVMNKKLTSALGWTRYFFGRPDKNKRDLNVAVAHEPQNLSVAIINREFYRIWRDSVYGPLVGKVRLKAQIHDSILFCYRPDFDPTIIQKQYMSSSVPVTDPTGTTRSMMIPTDIGSGGTKWSDLK